MRFHGLRPALLAGLSLVAISTLAPSADAATYKVVTSLNGTKAALPWYGAPTVDSAGNVYLPTYGGGDSNGNGNGTLVKIDRRGRTTVLHSFNGADGAHPYGGVLYSESDGKIFGTTCDGGAGEHGYGGVLYEQDPDGTYNVLHSFGNDGDGICPVDAPVRDGEGNLYGVTNGDSVSGCGMIWKFSSKGIYAILHTLDGPSYGCNPFGRLIWDKSGTILIGTASGGGNYNFGTVFFYITGTGGYGTSADFDGANGEYPYGFLVTDKHGNLYGTTEYGGAYGGGVIFKVNPYKGPTQTVVHSFNPNDNMGYVPVGSLVLIHDTLYGTTSQTGSSGGCGVVFEAGIKKPYFYDVLHTFTETTDGCSPEAGLVAGPNHYLYGDTRNGGSDGNGIVFRVRP